MDVLNLVDADSEDKLTEAVKTLRAYAHVDGRRAGMGDQSKEPGTRPPTSSSAACNPVCMQYKPDIARKWRKRGKVRKPLFLDDASGNMATFFATRRDFRNRSKYGDGLETVVDTRRAAISCGS